MEASAIRYVPQPRRKNLIEMFAAVDLRLVASGHVHQRRDFTFGHTRHVWAPSAGFIIPDRMQEVIGTKEVGLVEYRFQPDSFEVRHVRAPGQTDVGSGFADWQEMMERVRLPLIVTRSIALISA